MKKVPLWICSCCVAALVWLGMCVGAVAILSNQLFFFKNQTGQQILAKHQMTLTGHTGSVLSVVFSSDGKRLASSSLDGSFRLWDADTGHETATYQDDVISLAFSPDGNLLAGANRLNGSFTHWKLTMASQSEVIAQ